jgi:hypothetical protein
MVFTGTAPFGQFFFIGAMFVQIIGEVAHTVLS